MAQNTAIYGVIASLYSALRKGCGARRVITRVHAFATVPKTRVFTAFFSSFHNIPHKDVEQGKLSQASMPLATMPKTLVFTALLFLCVLRVADFGLTHSISETETV